MRGLVLLVGLGLVCCSQPASSQATDPSKDKKAEAAADSIYSSWYAFQQGGLDLTKRWAVILHGPTRFLLDSLLDRGVRVVMAFAPEHGLWGLSQAGESVRDTIYRGVSVYSLYGSRRAPLPQQLEGVDAVLFALRDVGVRCYTYLSTLSLTLQAASVAKKPVWVLDFPNPHAHYAYGPLLDSSLFSFVGLHATPLVLGLTIGEYAQLLVRERWVPPVDLHVVWWVGWRRRGEKPWAMEARRFWEEPPSPALKTEAAIHLYPILVWYEATCCISVGRGLPESFTLVGGPLEWALPGDTVLYGYRLWARTFTPKAGPRAGKPCKGWHIEPPSVIIPDSLFSLGVYLLKTFYQASGEVDAFFQDEFFDKLTGTPIFRWALPKVSLGELRQMWEAPAAWQILRRQYQVYPD